MNKSIIGNFLTQPNSDFPVDCETLAGLQSNQFILAILGNIAGDKSILFGCEPEQNGASRTPGYVFLRTNAFPEGEVLYWEGGNATGSIFLKTESVAIAAQGNNYPQAYTVRSLAPGVGSENFNWADFKAIQSNRELEEHSDDQDTTIAGLAPPPLGIVQMWAGALNKIPTPDYRLCDGSELVISEFPALYAILGNIHGGTQGSTFRLPDLRGRFIVGYDPAQGGDYSAIANKGGEASHTLTIAEMPAHNHGLFLVNNGTRLTGGGKANELNTGSGSTGNTGSGNAHENRPPYYTLAYIMRVK